jgi:Protein of unknown function (DUF4019)
MAEFFAAYGPIMIVVSGPLAGLVLLASHVIQISKLRSENSKLHAEKSVVEEVHFNRKIVTTCLLLLLSGPLLYFQMKRLSPHSGSSKLQVQEAASHMEDARRAVQRVLALADAGDYAAIYDAYSDRFRNSKTRDSFVADFNKARKPLGGVLSRDLETVESFDGLADKGIKNYTVVYRYKTRFAGEKVWLETVILAFENHEWKAVGYVLAPTANEPSATTGKPADRELAS